MFVEERLQEIINLLNLNGKIIVKDLSIKFDVTEDCIRKDLKILEKNGLIKRTYGGAVLSRESSLNRTIVSRKNLDIESKQRIAEKVYEIIKERETIFLDIASTNIVVAEYIAQGRKKMTVISNMVDVIQILSQCPNVEVIGIGGVLNKELSGFIGSSTIEYISKYKVDRAFIGSCGVDVADHSITTFLVEDGNTKRAIMNASKKTYLVIGSKKFYSDGVYKFAEIYDFDTIVVDEMPDPKVEYLLEQFNVNLV
ncbi:MAG: DeoR/GlpR transcriptional regulator [Firmicutes bacterium HGW-Firmicutes-7]|nr:MAG: DeoR/GlpR transcriptional regulator [Firmicutes bacterium HGW-Firmicutes-7]